MAAAAVTLEQSAPVLQLFVASLPTHRYCMTRCCVTALHDLPTLRLFVLYAAASQQQALRTCCWLVPCLLTLSDTEHPQPPLSCHGGC